MSQTDRLVIDAINATLKAEYRVLDGRPIYQLVWSEDPLEKRMGTYTDWYGSIMIRQEHKCLREIKKYWYVKPPCWVLEKLVFLPRQAQMKELLEELVQAQNGTYEIIFKFWSASKGVALPVVHEVVECILNRLHNPTQLRPSDFAEIQRLEEKAEVKYFEDQLSENERPELFVWDNSAFVSTNQLKFRETYTEKIDKLVTLS
jgi:hypothetical protein